MHSTAFENAYFLQSIGWAILNSFWQGGLLWLLYKFIVSLNPKSSAVFKHDLSLVFLFTSFGWFVFTIATTYNFLKNSSGTPGLLFNSPAYLVNFQQLDVVLPYLSVLYVGLLCFYVMRFIYNYQKIISLQKTEFIKAPFDLRHFTKNIALHVGIKRTVKVWLSEHIDVPSVIGFIKPVILLPAAIVNHLTTDQLEAVLLHELAHIKRNDYFINLLQTVIEIVLFFNPFVKLLGNCIKKERENCCDDWVVNYQYNKHEYANALLILEERRKQQLMLAMAATNKKEFLLQRIKRLFNAEVQTNINSLQRFQLITVGVLLFAGIFFLFPFSNNKVDNINLPSVTKTYSSFKIQPLAIAYHPVINKEVVTNEPVSSPVIIQPLIAKKRVIKKAEVNNTNTNTNYTLALINKDLLNGHMQSIAIAANQKDVPDSSYYIKVEEQESGKKQTNVYYFQLNTDNGQTSVKPLMLLKKHLNKKASVKKSVSLVSTSPKRVTS
jgi:bla regulator protein BlaR1